MSSMKPLAATAAAPQPIAKDKKAHKKKAPIPVIIYPSAPVVIPPRLYSSIEVLVKDALLYGQNHSGMRKSVSALVFAMRSAADESAGHVTADILALEAVLKRTDPNQRELPFREPEREPIQELQRQAHLDRDQVNAADFIKTIWTAWGRHLAIAGRSYSGGGSTPRELRDPFLSMGQDLWNDWRKVYTPWYDGAKKRVERSGNGGMVASTKLVMSVVMESIFPGALDRTLDLTRGTSLRVLKSELSELSRAQERGARI